MSGGLLQNKGAPKTESRFRPEQRVPDADDLENNNATKSKGFMNPQIHTRSLGYVARAFPAGVSASRRWRFAAPLVVALVVAGCASSELGDPNMAVNKTPSRPGRVLVYDFAVTPTDLPADAPVGARMSSGVQLSPEQIATDRKLGSEMAAQLARAIQEMGLPAERVVLGAPPQVNAVVIRGCLVSAHEGDAARRFSIGFDFRASEVMAAVEGFQVTEQGVGRPLDLAAGTAPAVPAGATPGIIFSSGMKIRDEAGFRTGSESWSRQAVKEIAERLKTRFREQGWIN